MIDFAGWSMVKWFGWNMVKWFGHVMRMEDDRLVKKILRSIMKGLIKGG